MYLHPSISKAGLGDALGLCDVLGAGWGQDEGLRVEMLWSFRWDEAAGRDQSPLGKGSFSSCESGAQPIKPAVLQG